MSKKNKLFLLLLLFIVVVLLVLNSSNFIFKINDIKAKITISNSFKYLNEKNEEKIFTLYSDNLKNAIERELKDVETIKLYKAKIINDEKEYNAFLSFDLGKIDNIKRKDLMIYEVEYYVKYKEGSIVPLDSGKQMMQYILIKNNDGKWIISSIGL